MLMDNHLNGFGVFMSGDCECTPALATGDRTARITVGITGFAWDAGTDSNLVDGATAANGTDSVDIPASFPDGSTIRFTFSSATKVSKVKPIISGAFTLGDWKIWTGNGAMTVDHGTFTFTGTGSVEYTMTGALGGYLDLYMQKIGTETPTNTWWNDIHFTECTCS